MDDERSIRFVLRQALRERGWEVDEVDDGAVVEESLERTRYDLLLLDLYMPGMNGFEVLRQVRRHDPGLLPARKTPSDVRVLVLSSESNEASIEHARAAGADSYLTKPFDVDELAERVRGLLS